VKRSGRDEPIWFVIHICVVTTLGISLCSYLYLKLAKKKNCVFLTCYIFSSTKLEKKRIEEVLPGIRSGGRGGKVAKIICTCVSKCKNDT
jgi:hypothetical protein